MTAPAAIHDRLVGDRIVRFDDGERVLHWVVALLVLVLATTGAILYFDFLSTRVGRREVLRTVHLWSGLALPVPVLGVPVQSRALNGLDSLLSIVQMPAGIPVATFAIGQAGAANAALFAAAMLAYELPDVGAALEAFRARQTADVMQNDDPRR